MMTYNQVLTLFTILSLFAHEIIGQPLPDQDAPIFHRNMETTEQCQTETAALGALGDYSTLDPAAFLTSGQCKLSMENGLSAECDNKDVDNLQECIDAGGQHHLMTLDFKCDKTKLKVENFPICVGASCDLKNVKEVAKPELEGAISAALSNFGQQVDPDQCTTTFEATKSTPAKSKDDGGTNDGGTDDAGTDDAGTDDDEEDDSDSGSTRHITWTSIIIMAAALILFVV